MRLVNKAYKSTTLNARRLINVCIYVLIRILPCKVHLIETMGALGGLHYMLANAGQWHPLKLYAKRIGNTMPVWLFIVTYFVKRGIDSRWEDAYVELTPSLNKYVSLKNRELLELALRDGKGAVLLGAHYGPLLYSYLLAENGIEVKRLVSEENLIRWGETSRAAIGPLAGKLYAFLSDNKTSLVSGRSEKDLVYHLRRGGVVFMMSDFIAAGREKGTPGLFPELELEPSSFPFRLSLKYSAPIFFYYPEKKKRGGYTFHLIPSRGFTTPQEGMIEYDIFLRRLIDTDPFMWGAATTLRDKR